MKLVYENKLGKVVFTGGGDGVFRLTKLSGLSFPETETDAVRYAGEPGQTVTKISVLPRTITIAGDVKDENGKQVAYAAKVLSYEGTLTVITSYVKRKNSCRCISFTPEGKRGIFVPFTMQLICDNPYFEDTTQTSVTIAKRESLFTSPFVLPVMFSARRNEAKVLNRGSVKTMPVITVTAKEDAPCEKGILLQNETTGACLLLSCGIRAGETVTIDCKNRKIHSDIRGDLLEYLSCNTPMSQFYLQLGINDISIYAENETTPIFAFCRFQNQYGEAIL